jgi:indolepyruvate ferredoxin oxidoreductase
MQRKLKLGPWFAPMFRLLRAGRRLRGTWADPFGLPKVRRVERALVGEYRDLVRMAAERLAPGNRGTVLAIAELADVVRGYEDVKLRNVERFRADADRLTEELRTGRAQLPMVKAS